MLDSEEVIKTYQGLIWRGSHWPKFMWEARELLTVQVCSFTPFMLDTQNGFYPFNPLIFWLEAAKGYLEIGLQIKLIFKQSAKISLNANLPEVFIKAKNWIPLAEQ